jgi:cytoskeleton protein RodZ
MPEIGQALREARMRARIDVSEIEAQTKIRAKYLRALENEEWDLLPGPTFVKSFLRTYGQALGLDGKMLVEEYRVNYERPNDSALEPIVSTASRPQGAGRRGGAGGSRRGGAGRRGAAARSGGSTGPSRGYTIAIAAVSVLVIVLVVALLAGGSSNNNPTTPAGSTAPGGTGAHHRTQRATGHLPASLTSQSQVMALSIQPTASVYVCLLGDNERKLIPGATLEPGSTQPTFHAKHFLLTLGNNAVKLYIDGSLRVVPPSSKPIGYSITKAGGRHSLPSSQQPTCH